MSEQAKPEAPWVPRPFDEEELENWRWIYAERKTDRLRPYGGKWIAVYQKKIVESGRDPEMMRKYVALRDGIDPNKITLAFLD